MEPVVEELVQYAQDELALRREQGCDTWEWERIVALFRDEPGPEPEKRIRSLARSIQALQPDEDYPYTEPDHLDAIRALRPDGPRAIAKGIAPDAQEEATVGAWTGYVVGCMAGRPVRHWHRVKVDGLLRVCGIDGLAEYLPEPTKGRGFDFPESMRPLLRGHITAAARCDVTDAAILNLGLIERQGVDLKPGAIADAWLRNIPYGGTARAQRAAYRNLVNGLQPPESATFGNALREWIGAMSRAAVWGWALPGQPQDAAAVAWKDAQISHVRNGLYAAMWIAAMASSAFVLDDAEQVVRMGLTEIPSTCRLAATVAKLLEWRTEGLGAVEAVERVLVECSTYNPMHVIPNAAIIACALLWGGGDFSRTVSNAVTGGFDTAGNAAVAGSIAGIMGGEDAVADRWTAPLHDTVLTDIPGQSPCTVTGLARRTSAVQAVLQQEIEPR